MHGHPLVTVVTHISAPLTAAINGAHDSYITVASKAQITSGEVAYKLGAPWGQNIGIDTHPVLGGKKVYCGYLCSGEKGYSNSAEVGETSIAHSYENGICEICNSYEPAVYIEEKGCYEISNAGQLIGLLRRSITAERISMPF